MVVARSFSFFLLPPVFFDFDFEKDVLAGRGCTSESNFLISFVFVETFKVAGTCVEIGAGGEMPDFMDVVVRVDARKG